VPRFQYSSRSTSRLNCPLIEMINCDSDKDSDKDSNGWRHRRPYRRRRRRCRQLRAAEVGLDSFGRNGCASFANALIAYLQIGNLKMRASSRSVSTIAAASRTHCATRRARTEEGRRGNTAAPTGPNPCLCGPLCRRRGEWVAVWRRWHGDERNISRRCEINGSEPAIL
jgi:hypothetical protein